MTGLVQLLAPAGLVPLLPQRQLEVRTSVTRNVSPSASRLTVWRFSIWVPPGCSEFCIRVVSASLRMPFWC